ncbi:MAG: plasmid pRiA4b ORF-3 family protein [Candidatus Accumulibacter sp.]|jgi:hypothetical protein|nr:plasmid pRiA4b ORF-3 family protein [Accumulibacter sp.]
MENEVRSSKRRAAPALLQLKIELEWIEPVIWRRFVVPETLTLGKLHDVIQVVMGWENCHLHEFDIAGGRYGISDPEFEWEEETVRSERRVRLVTALRGKKSFRYIYDFGDHWEHRIKVEKVLPPDPAFESVLCLAGANACPPEDVGGSSAYMNFVEAISDPEHRDHDDIMEWFAGPFDPAAFDLEDVKLRLRRIKL